jgi:hypothetical protein
MDLCAVKVFNQNQIVAEYTSSAYFLSILFDVLQTLLESLGMLEKMIHEFRLEKQDKANTIAAESLMARCEAMYLKIK